MTIEEAIRIARAIMAINFKQWKAIKVLTQSAEKQIPKKVMNMGDFDYCPDCKERGWRWIAGSADDYCPNCGQRLDWGDDE